MKVRRVGSITCGMLLIVFGILFALHFFLPALSYEKIFCFWPCLLIMLGAEMLLSNRKYGENVTVKYDGAAIFLTVMLEFFAMGMGVVEYCMEHTQWISL